MLELEFYCQIQGLEYQIFDSNQEYYVHIKGDNADSDVVRYLILQKYPAAVAVSVNPNVSVIYRVGTVFDLIEHAGAQQPVELHSGIFYSPYIPLVPFSDPLGERE